MGKPLILITNDDGINATGIARLAEYMSELGDVVVVAPDQLRSGQGHAITIETPLKYRRLNNNGNYPVYICNGTPVDSVKIAKSYILERNPDILVSGINHGSNSSVNIIYSGTIAAVLEGAMAGIPSVGYSLLSIADDADFEPTRPFVINLARRVLDEGLPDGVALNVNFPNTQEQTIHGIKICRQAKAFWEEDFELREDPHQREYFWMKGQFRDVDQGRDTDEWALKNGYASVVPVQYDFTAHHVLNDLKNWEENV